MAQLMNNAQKRKLIIDTITKKKKISGKDLKEETGLKPQDLGTICKALLADNVIRKVGEKLEMVAVAPAAPVPAKTAGGKISRPVKAAPVAEPEEDSVEDLDDEDLIAEYEAVAAQPAKKQDADRFAELEAEMTERGLFEDEGDSEPEEEEISDEDAIEEYDTLSKKSRRNKTDQARLEELEGILESRGLFEDAADEGTEEADEGDEVDDMFEDDAEEGTPDEDDDDDEPVKAPKVGGSKKGKGVAQPEKAFSMAFKPIDTLTDSELEVRINRATEAAELYHGQGDLAVSEMLYRSVCRARKQLNKRHEA